MAFDLQEDKKSNYEQMKQGLADQNDGISLIEEVCPNSLLLFTHPAPIPDSSNVPYFHTLKSLFWGKK